MVAVNAHFESTCRYYFNLHGLVWETPYQAKYFSTPPGRKPREEWFFVGELVVKSVKLVSGKEFQDKYASRAVEIDIPFPKPHEKAWIIEFKQLVKYERPVKLKECTDIKIN